MTLTPPSGTTFPLGDATVEAVAVDFAGNRSTKTFVVTVEDTTAPELVLPSDLTVEATGPSGAVANFSATAHDLVSGEVPVTFSIPPGSTFPLGTTVVTATAVDGSENTATGTFNVTVRDTRPPVIQSLTASPNLLWPPNHQMVAVTLTAQVQDVGDPTPQTSIVLVTSNEPVNGTGDGDTAPDWVITGPLTVNLRSERAGGGNGRAYTITVRSRDRFGNTSTRTVKVYVPQSSGRLP